VEGRGKLRVNADMLGVCIQDFNDLNIVKEKLRPNETPVLFYKAIVQAGLPNRRIQSLCDGSLN